MKNARKLLAAVLAFVMIFALAATAFADGDDNNTITFTISVANDDTHEYAIYQIFTGDFYNGALSNIQWGTAGEGTGSVNKATLDTLTALNEKSDSEKLAEIEKLLNSNATPFDTIGGSGEGAKKSAEVPAGYYIIKDSGELTDETDTYTLYITEVVENVTIERKAKPVTMTKTVEDGDKNTANIGDTVSFQLTATLPENYADYKDFYMSFNDTLSDGLKLKASTIKVCVDGVQMSGTSGEGDTKTGNYYIYGDQNKFSVVIYDLKTVCPTAMKNSKVVVSYDAVLTTDATIGNDGNKNTATLAFSNDPNVAINAKPNANDVPGTPGTPEDPDQPTPPDKPVNPTIPENPEVPDDPGFPGDGKHPIGETANGETKTYTFGLKITKTDGNSQPLAGAEFVLTSTGTMNVVVTTGIEYREATTEENATYWLLKDGTYTDKKPTEATLNLYKEATTVDASAKYVKVEYTRKELKQDTQADTAAPIKGFVGDDGVLKFEGLKAGKYKLHESTTPQGYNTLTEDVVIEIKWVDATGSVENNNLVPAHFEATSPYLVVETGENANPTGKLSEDEDTGLFAITIVNNAGVELPTTGGIGTTIFYVVGAIMVLGAGVLLITKKRMGM